MDETSPLGLCIECLVDNNKPTEPAVLLFLGTGYCELHAREAYDRQPARTLFPDLGL